MSADLGRNIYTAAPPTGNAPHADLDPGCIKLIASLPGRRAFTGSASQGPAGTGAATVVLAPGLIRAVGAGRHLGLPDLADPRS